MTFSCAAFRLVEATSMFGLFESARSTSESISDEWYAFHHFSVTASSRENSSDFTFSGVRVKLSALVDSGVLKSGPTTQPQSTLHSKVGAAAQRSDEYLIFQALVLHVDHTCMSPPKPLRRRFGLILRSASKRIAGTTSNRNTGPSNMPPTTTVANGR